MPETENLLPPPGTGESRSQYRAVVDFLGYTTILEIWT
jgi:hypothetical protein